MHRPKDSSLPRIRAEERAQLPRAATGHLQLSGRESLRVLDLLENPPKPNTKLRAAARALPKRQQS
ncbi:MAG: DUF1778 domain-containing protein [Bryobacteraceae bacterium]